MLAPTSRKVFINLPVRDLPRSIAFFTKLGFAFNPQFTDENGTCMLLSDEGYVMLLNHGRFKDFIDRDICDATRTEVLIALSCSSRAEVDEMVHTALESGGSAAMPSQDHGFMYGWSFRDPDGHHWEVVWMDPSAQAPAQ